MRTQANTTQQGKGSGSADAMRMIALSLIDLPPNNTRRQFKKESLAELAQSIKQKGVIQPILVRPVGRRFQIVAGERRFRAANKAGLKEIPATIKAMSDDEALDAQLIENLQRENIHPLDEADGFLRLKETSNLEISDIAQRVAKDQRYVARRLSLTKLIKEARKDFRDELITLAHALEISRLSIEIQPYALAACYEKTHVWDQKTQSHITQPDKERPAHHVRYVQDWIQQNVYLNLGKAPFKLDARLREDGLTCVECPERSGFNQMLFHDISEKDTCLNPICFRSKVQAFVQIKKEEIETKSAKPATYISPYYTATDVKDALGTCDYRVLEKKADRCEFAEQAVYAEGQQIGQVIWICRDKTCKDHLGRVGTSHSSSASASRASSSSQSGEGAEKRNQRKQELFNIKVDEEVRKRVMKEALMTYGFPFERAHLNEVAKEFFRRIPSDDQRTICEVFGWNDDLASKLRYDQPAVLRELAKLDDSQLAQFMMLCSFAHYGANTYKQNQVNQQSVEKLSKERDINHTLIDAQVRVELCAKKYRAAHQTYLDAVTDGRKAKMPVVYEAAA